MKPVTESANKPCKIITIDFKNKRKLTSFWSDTLEIWKCNVCSTKYNNTLSAGSVPRLDLDIEVPAGLQWKVQSVKICKDCVELMNSALKED